MLSISALDFDAGLIAKFAPTLPKTLSYLRLVNLRFRNQTLDVLTSRLPSGRIAHLSTV